MALIFYILIALIVAVAAFALWHLINDDFPPGSMWG